MTRRVQSFEEQVDEMMPEKSDMKWLIMNYLITEGHYAAAEKFFQEATPRGFPDPDSILKGIQERDRIRNALHAGDAAGAIEMINDLDPEILDSNHPLHFDLLQLQLIEIIRKVIAKSADELSMTEFRPALEFATEQLSPRAPTDAKYQQALERTMALMIFPPEKMAPEFKELLDLKLREKVATSVNKVILEGRHLRSEPRLVHLVRLRTWCQTQGKDSKSDVPSQVSIGLDDSDDLKEGDNRDAMVS